MGLGKPPAAHGTPVAAQALGRPVLRQFVRHQFGGGVEGGRAAAAPAEQRALVDGQRVPPQCLPAGEGAATGGTWQPAALQVGA